MYSVVYIMRVLEKFEEKKFFFFLLNIFFLLFIQRNKYISTKIFHMCFFLTKIYSHKNGSILISRTEHGKFNSNLVITSGCKTPSEPITLLLTTISAHRPGKYIESKLNENFKKFNKLYVYF